MRAVVSVLGILAILVLAVLIRQRPSPRALYNSTGADGDTVSTAATVGIVTPSVEIAPEPAPGPSTQVTAAGVDMRIQLSPGPYFLGQLVAADVALTIHTARPLELPDLREAGSCGAALSVILVGNAAPHYTLPNETLHSCPAPDVFALQPGTR